MKVVTLTKVKRPWYLVPFILKHLFIKSKPEYAKISGLEFKYYHLSNNNENSGGLYLWKDRVYAEDQFNDNWFKTEKND